MSTPELRAADNGVYYIHWTDGRRSKRLSTGQKEVSKAKLFLGHWLLLESEAPRAKNVVYTVAELWTAYEKGHVLNGDIADPATSQAIWRNLEPFFGPMKPVEIDQDVVDEYQEKRASGKIGKPANANTARKELIILRACLNWCAKKRGNKLLLAKEHIPEFELPTAGPPRDRWLRTAEIQKLLNAAQEIRISLGDSRMSRGERFLWLALETAARKQAIYDLTWDRIDLETNVVHFEVPGRRQTKKRRASVPISKALMPVIERMQKERVRPNDPTELVLDNKGEIWTSVQLIAIKAGLSPGTRGPVSNTNKPKATGISPHVLRHTAATHMARRGVPIWIIAKVLGNTLAVVEKTYAKHCPDDLRHGVNQISGGALTMAD